MVECSSWLEPADFGFASTGSGWRKTIGGREVLFEHLSWEHAHSPSYDIVDGKREELDALQFVERLQYKTWGFPAEVIVPSNILAIIPDGGGSILVAYDAELGFNADGWRGFVFGLGGRSGQYVSHMMGVHADVRGSANLGWYLKILQAHGALRNGHRSMVWTYNPNRGANARLNIDKLGSVVYDFTIDKYGVLDSTLYGAVPNDRFTAYWGLDEERTIERIRAVGDGSYRSPSLADIAGVPTATNDGAATLAASSEKIVRVEIPGDIDRVMREDPNRALAWGRDLRAVLSALMTTKEATGAIPGR
jgi:predicted GNAT superfamily acetyltransferase